MNFETKSSNDTGVAIRNSRGAVGWFFWQDAWLHALFSLSETGLIVQGGQSKPLSETEKRELHTLQTDIQEMERDITQIEEESARRTQGVQQDLESPAITADPEHPASPDARGES